MARKNYDGMDVLDGLGYYSINSIETIRNFNSIETSFSIALSPVSKSGDRQRFCFKKIVSTTWATSTTSIIPLYKSEKGLLYMYNGVRNPVEVDEVVEAYKELKNANLSTYSFSLSPVSKSGDRLGEKKSNFHTNPVSFDNIKYYQPQEIK